MVRRTFLQVYVILILFGCNHASPSPTPISTISPRTPGRMQNFPWRESWRLNVRLNYEDDFVATEAGIVFLDNPEPGENRLKFGEAKDGTLRWETDTVDYVQEMVTDTNLLYIVGDQNSSYVSVAAYSLKTGKLVWQSKEVLPTRRAYSLHLQGDALYIYDITATLIYVFDALSGDLVEYYQRSRRDEDYTILMQFEDKNRLQQQRTGALIFMREDELIWQTDVNEAHHKVMIKPLPAVHKDILIVRFIEYKQGVAFDSLAGINLNTGEILWRRSNEFYSDFEVDDGLIYVISKEAKILIIDVKNGETVGFLELLPAEVDTIHPISTIAVTGNRLYVYFLDSRELIAFERINN